MKKFIYWLIMGCLFVALSILTVGAFAATYQSFVLNEMGDVMIGISFSLISLAMTVGFSADAVSLYEDVKSDL